MTVSVCCRYPEFRTGTTESLLGKRQLAQAGLVGGQSQVFVGRLKPRPDPHALADQFCCLRCYATWNWQDQATG